MPRAVVATRPHDQRIAPVAAVAHRTLKLAQRGCRNERHIAEGEKQIVPTGDCAHAVGDAVSHPQVCLAGENDGWRLVLQSPS